MRGRTGAEGQRRETGTVPSTPHPTSLRSATFSRTGRRAAIDNRPHLAHIPTIA